ncbi:MAG: hypothetical protein AAFZ38_01995, partial [Myxococcota bacterium]
AARWNQTPSPVRSESFFACSFGGRGLAAPTAATSGATREAGAGCVTISEPLPARIHLEVTAYHHQ